MVGIPGVGITNTIGALDFVGFTDPGKAISSITLYAGTSNGYDYIGLDDVRVPAVPEPASLALRFGGGRRSLPESSWSVIEIDSAPRR